MHTGRSLGLEKCPCFAKGQPMTCLALLPSCPPTARPQKPLSAICVQGVEGRFCSRTALPQVVAGFCLAFLTVAAPHSLPAVSCESVGSELSICSLPTVLSGPTKETLTFKAGRVKPRCASLKSLFPPAEPCQALESLSCAGARMSHCSENSVILGNTRIPSTCTSAPPGDHLSEGRINPRC